MVRGVRELIKLYDSIPAYYEINHLPERDFYGTLDYLKETFSELKEKSKSMSSITSSPCDICTENVKKTTRKTRSEKKSCRSVTPSTVRSCPVRMNHTGKREISSEDVEKASSVAPKEISLHNEDNVKVISNNGKRKNKSPNIFSPNADSVKSLTATPLVAPSQPKLEGYLKSFPPCKKKTKNKRQFTFLGFDMDSQKSRRCASLSATPIYPAARPNLAATLRAEVSRKKRCESIDCVSRNSFNPVDWEIRKTPAWKSLYHDDSHKHDIPIRVATRKAEQKMQQKEYQLNMELMRQRVKAAPLLLEGTGTYWGPRCRYFSHSCSNAKTINRSSPRTKVSKDLRKKRSVQTPQTCDSDDVESEDRRYL